MECSDTDETQCYKIKSMQLNLNANLVTLVFSRGSVHDTEKSCNKFVAVKNNQNVIRFSFYLCLFFTPPPPPHLE
jgi:hypothetical protein